MTPPTPPTPPTPRRRARPTQDLLFVAGFGLAVTGIGMVSVPAALVTAGILLMYPTFRAAANRSQPPRGE